MKAIPHGLLLCVTALVLPQVSAQKNMAASPDSGFVQHTSVYLYGGACAGLIPAIDLNSNYSSTMQVGSANTLGVDAGMQFIVHRKKYFAFHTDLFMNTRRLNYQTSSSISSGLIRSHSEIKAHVLYTGFGFYPELVCGHKAQFYAYAGPQFGFYSSVSNDIRTTSGIVGGGDSTYTTSGKGLIAFPFGSNEVGLGIGFGWRNIQAGPLHLLFGVKCMPFAFPLTQPALQGYGKGPFNYTISTLSVVAGVRLTDFVQEPE